MNEQQYDMLVQANVDVRVARNLHNKLSDSSFEF